jgi:hypothetical protein
MLSSPQSEKELDGASNALKPVAVRKQLKRLLAHPLFTNSKRYPVLLAYTVEQTLLGNAGELKERTIGIKAFGREPIYDVALDPVVRTTAAEVRKRLIQYYYSPEHAGELIIEMPTGSYVPTFREPVVPTTAEGAVAASGQTPSQHSVAEAGPPAARNRRRWVSIGVALAVALLAGFGLGRMKLSGESSNLERFWAPIASASSRITYCLGMPMDGTDQAHFTLSQGMPVSGGLDASDVITLARSIVPLVPRHDAFRVVSASQTSFAQLRESPFVLIGAFDNIWTMRLTQDLPFGFESDGQVRKLIDRKSAHPRSWTLQWQVPYTKLAKDYAIVARIRDNVTGQPVIMVAGILGEGTEAKWCPTPFIWTPCCEKHPKTGSISIWKQ